MTGVEILQNELKKLPLQPGVYRMLDAKGEVLYVGKAKSLKKRVASYTKLDRLPDRLKRMVSRIAALEVVLTRTEAEALLLEGNLIKEFRPHFNILLKDDKSFPFILLAGDHEWPRLMKHRGAKNLKGDYYGPFASGTAVNLTLNILERAFLLRTCSDAVFANRTRPCLLYQIKRCSGPCAGRITAQAYQALVAEARDFLSGRSHAVQQALAKRMEEAAEDLEYEKAAEFRDRIQALSRIQARQDISLSGIADADVAAIHQDGGKACVQVFFFRAGQNFGNRAYFPAGTDGEEAGEVLQAFLGQFYANRPPPPLILLSTPVPEVALIAEALSLRAGRKVDLAVPERGDKKKAVDHALINAREALTRRLSENAHTTELLEKLGDLAGLETMPERIEVFDNSHVMGTSAVGAMIVAGPEGFVKSAYRRYNIKSTDLTPGDDFGMMREVMSRRFQRAQKEDPERDRGLWPDLVLIDGGLGQLHAVEAALAEEGIEDVALIAIAKGPDRNAGKERLFLPGKTEPIQLPERDPLLYFLQRLRDEAHRFAIGSHRAKRSMAIGATPLDDVEGIGAGRKKALLNHFGSGKAVTEASVEELMKVPGISRATAKKIHDRFHGEG